MRDGTEKPAEPAESSQFLGHADIVAYRNQATGHQHWEEADGLVREGWLSCSECIAAGGAVVFGWSRPSFATADGIPSGQDDRALRPSVPQYKSRRG